MYIHFVYCVLATALFCCCSYSFLVGFALFFLLVVMFFCHCFFFFIPEIAASEPRVNRKQSLYLHEGVVMPAYTLSSLDVTCGISLGIQLDQHNRTNCQAASVVWIDLLQALPSLIFNSNFWISARHYVRIDAVFSVSSREFPWTVFSGMQAMGNWE